MIDNPTTDLYERAMEADQHLRAIEAAVDLLCYLVRPDDVMCAGCAWESIVKPLALPLVGWARGAPPRDAPDSMDDEFIDGTELHTLPRAEPATTAAEEWLRSGEAWTAVTDHWKRQLDAADPGNGHGLGGPRTDQRLHQGATAK